MGLMRLALKAGIIPAMVPAMTMTSVASRQTSMPTVGLLNMVAWKSPASTLVCPSVASIHSLTPMPSSMPM